jgi:mannose-6-phosphate isomerase-like protein (cupin superfamily)
MSILRRDILSFLPMAMATGLALPDFMNGSVPDGQSSVLPSAIFPFDSLEVHASATAQVRPILKGKLATGESIEVHETTLPPGGAPHPAHHHEHTEMWLIREGTVELTIEGKSHRLSGGSLGYVRSNEEHGITNPSDKPATYFVVAVGPGSDK